MPSSYKMMTDFTYNSGASSLFTIDNSTATAAILLPTRFITKWWTSTAARKISAKRLIRLTPVFDIHNAKAILILRPGPASAYPIRLFPACQHHYDQHHVHAGSNRCLNGGTTNLRFSIAAIQFPHRLVQQLIVQPQCESSQPDL